MTWKNVQDRTYENPFRVYNMNGKNYVYDSVTGESLFNAPEEQGFKGLSKFFEKHFKNLKKLAGSSVIP